MPKPNALVAHVKNITPRPDTETAAPSGLVAVREVAKAQRVTVGFEGERTAFLPPGKRAAVWQGMLEFTRQYNLPAYVEIDPETSVITRVLIPMRVRVVAIEPAAGGDIDVTFIESHARHHLLPSNPDFQDMLNALEAARVAGTEVLVTSTRDEHEIIDVRLSAPGPAPVDDFEDPPPSVVSEAQATQLFNEMAATTCDPLNILAPCIPFLYPDDGCYARAHEMIRLMRLQGIEGEKIWIFGNLQPATSNHPGRLGVSRCANVAGQHFVRRREASRRPFAHDRPGDRGCLENPAKRPRRNVRVHRCPAVLAAQQRERR